VMHDHDLAGLEPRQDLAIGLSCSWHDSKVAGKAAARRSRSPLPSEHARRRFLRRELDTDQCFAAQRRASLHAPGRTCGARRNSAGEPSK
jgi:hypothetical protein